MSERPTPRLGVFGGSFDPPHLGHVRAAAEAAARLDLERVLWVPAGQNPLKPPPVAGAADRLALVRAAIAGEPRFALSEVETRRAGPTYTVETLDALQTEHPGRRLVLLMGADAWADLGRWRDPWGVLARADVGVFVRPGHGRPRPGEVLQGVDPPGGVGYNTEHLDGEWRLSFEHEAGGGSRVTFLDTTPLPISSTAIRDRCRSGGNLRDLRDLIPDDVCIEMERRGLYGL